MALIDYVYLDDTLTTQFDDTVPLTLAAQNGQSGDAVLYVGLPDDTQKIQANSAPGIDPITVTIADAAAGSGVEATHVKLALTQAGLTAATGGASLDLGATINGGAANRVAVWVRWTNSTGAGTSTEISLGLPAIAQSAL